MRLIRRRLAPSMLGERSAADRRRGKGADDGLAWQRSRPGRAALRVGDRDRAATRPSRDASASESESEAPRSPTTGDDSELWCVDADGDASATSSAGDARWSSRDAGPGFRRAPSDGVAAPTATVRDSPRRRWSRRAGRHSSTTPAPTSGAAPRTRRRLYEDDDGDDRRRRPAGQGGAGGGCPHRLRRRQPAPSTSAAPAWTPTATARWSTATLPGRHPFPDCDDRNSGAGQERSVMTDADGDDWGDDMRPTRGRQTARQEDVGRAERTPRVHAGRDGDGHGEAAAPGVVAGRCYAHPLREQVC